MSRSTIMCRGLMDMNITRNDPSWLPIRSFAGMRRSGNTYFKLRRPSSSRSDARSLMGTLESISWTAAILAMQLASSSLKAC